MLKMTISQIRGATLLLVEYMTVSFNSPISDVWGFAAQHPDRAQWATLYLECELQCVPPNLLLVLRKEKRQKQAVLAILRELHHP